MAHPNEDLVRRAFDAFAIGDVDTMRELTDQDAVWHTPGRNLVSVRYRAKTRSWASLPRSRSSPAGPSAPSSTTSWPTRSMRSRSMSLAASARAGPWRTERCS